MRQARQAVVQQYGIGANNASTIYNINKTESPYYAIEPGTGAMYFHSPRAYSNWQKSMNNTDNTSAVIALAEQLKTQYKDLGNKEALELAIDQIRVTNNPTSRRRR